MTDSVRGNSTSAGGGPIFFCLLILVAVAVGLVVSGRTATQTAPEAERVLAAFPGSIKPLHASNTPGLRNVFRLGDSLYSGSAPEDSVGFESLSRLGIKTLVSVDGIPPDRENAQEWGIRPIHIPMTYSSVPRETMIELVRVTKEAPGPVYISSSHGTDRGPAAAVALWRTLDRSATSEQSTAALKVMGTDVRYQGLYDSIRNLTIPDSKELGVGLRDLPESSPVPPLSRAMAEIERMWDRVAAEPGDRSSTTLSMQLTTAYDVAEQLRESAHLGDATEVMQPDFQQAVDAVEKLAEIIRSEVRSQEAPSADRTAAVATVNRRCDACHQKYRQ